jgi:ferric-dicitrate binding protein FerR (iron transport regulator)
MINEDIIIKFLSGQATGEEAQEILRWKNLDEENRKTFREIEVAWNTSEIVMNPEKFDAATVLPQIRSKLKRDKVLFIGKNRLKQLTGYAATAIIAITLTWFAQNYSSTKHGSSQTVQAIYQSVETPAGAKSLVTLEDGTRIWLNAKSKLTYPAYFVNNIREVELEGEGYFDVAKDKSRPFRVKTSDLTVQVLGTVFNLKSYPEEGMIKATLVEGKIALNKFTDGNLEQEFLELKLNQQAMFIKKEGFLTKDEAVAAGIPLNEIHHRSKEKLIVDENIDPDEITAWKENKLIFKNETFESIAVKLERRYDAKIVFKDEAVRNYRFSGTFTEISITEALRALQFTSDFNFKIEQHTIFIRR